MKFQVFHCIAGLDEVDPEDPVEMDLADVYTELFGHLGEEDDFFGLIDANGVTLQVLYDAEEDLYWAEIPVPAEGGSYGCFLDFEEAAELLKSLPETFAPAKFPDFEFEAWDPDDLVDD